MKIEQLPTKTASKLSDLLNAIESSLNSIESPHIKAISQSLINHEEYSGLSMQGGNIRMPSRPPLKYNKSLISKLHKETLKSEGGVLCSIIVKAERLNTESRWVLSTKLISRVDYNIIIQDRHLIDKEVKNELLKIISGSHWERLSFGRDIPNKTPVIVIVANKIIEKSPPTLKLQDLLLKAEKVYSNYGLDLQVAYWTQRLAGKKIEFREYFE